MTMSVRSATNSPSGSRSRSTNQNHMSRNRNWNDTTNSYMAPSRNTEEQEASIPTMHRLEELRQRLSQEQDTKEKAWLVRPKNKSPKSCTSPPSKNKEQLRTSISPFTTTETTTTDPSRQQQELLLKNQSWSEIIPQLKKQYSLLHSDKRQVSTDLFHHNRAQESPEIMFLTDSFQRKHTYLRISLVEKCNLRCQYCMPPDGVQLQEESNLLTRDEIRRTVHLFSKQGVDKVRLTGGEPLLRKDLTHIISSIASTSPAVQSIGITTNGITLSRHLDDLIHAGLTHVNISLDTLQESKFEQITRRKGFQHVIQALHDACAKLPHGRVKVNCVVMKGFNDDELKDFVHFTKELPLDLRFIEWMPFQENGWNRNRFISYQKMLQILGTNHSPANPLENAIIPPLPTNQMFQMDTDDLIQPLVRLSDSPNDTTKWYRTTTERRGRIGFITSMTEHFCGSCNRLRITADGKLKVCLFGSSEISLRDALRDGISDDDFMYIVWAALQKKHYALGGHGSADGISRANNNRPMILIGG